MKKSKKKTKKQPVILVVLCNCGSTAPEPFNNTIGGTNDYSYGM